jgi:dolichol-phosphate mannosyltransferase
MIQPLGDEQRRRATLVSVVLPVFNEVAVLRQLVTEIDAALLPTGYQHEIVFVNDGSSDGSGELLDQLAKEFSHIRVVHFSRNFGHQPALQAGLLHASGQAIVIMDSDLQDDPQAIGRFLEKWEDGYDVVYAVRHSRKENVVKRGLFYAFYRVLNLISQLPLPKDSGNFGLVDRQVARQVAELLDRDRFYPGLRRWVGFRQVGIPVERHARHDDTPRVSMRQLFQLAKTAIFSFSACPLTVFYAIAGISLSACFALAIFALYHKLYTGLAIPGWTSMTLTASLFGALNALGIAILGEYVIRIYDQVRARPLFVVSRKVNLQDAEQTRVGHHISPIDAWDETYRPVLTRHEGTTSE